MIIGKITVGTDAVQVPFGDGDVPVIVNHGTTNLYFGSANTVTVDNGLPLGPGVAFEFPSNLQIAEWDAVWVIGDAADGDLRYGTVG